jgi:biotin operon repressor
MNAAKLSTSDRLQRVRDFLSDNQPHSTLEIVKKANVCAVNSAIAELRANGLKIDCWRRKDRFYYRLVA